VKKITLYCIYWTVYLLLFSLIEGLPSHDLFTAFRGELVSLPFKIIFVTIVVEQLADKLFHKYVIRFGTLYVLLLIAFAFALRLADNYIILRYLLPNWHKEPLLSAAPFLYNAIKLQFLVTIPFCIKLFYFRTEERTQADNAPAFLQVKCERRVVKISLTDICYIEAQGNYLTIYTLSGSYKTYMAISELEKELPASTFLRVHRSFIIALDRVESYSNAAVQIGQRQVPIGRSYQLKAKSALTPCLQRGQVITRP